MANTNGIFWQSNGNSKMEIPIVNLGSATACPSVSKCPYSSTNWKRTGSPKCYALKAEQRFPAVLAQRNNNYRMINNWTAGERRRHGKELGKVVGERCKRKGYKYVRINESGDLYTKALPFLRGLASMLEGYGVKLFTYTHASKGLQRKVEDMGIVVMRSDEDFVVVKDAKDAETPVCIGKGCGTTCLRCPKGRKTTVVAH